MEKRQKHSLPPISSPRKDGHWLTVSEVAERFHVSCNTVGRWVRDGLISAIDVSPNSKVGSHRPSWRISSESLDGFVASRANMLPPLAKAKPRRKPPDVFEFIK